MGNFLRRFLSFIFGMIFGFVALGATLLTVGYSIYKNASLSDLGVTEEEMDLGGLNDATIEELIALVVSASKDPSSYTFEELEKNYGFDVNGMLESMGVDLNSIHPDDVSAIRKLSPFLLAKENGFEELLNNMSFGVIFSFIPATDGVYPLFSAGARNKLRSYTLGDAMGNDENGEPKINAILSTLPIGSILSSVYSESYNENTATYSYATEDGGILDALGHLSLNAFNEIGGDFGHALNEGALTDLGTTPLSDLFGFEDDGSALTSAFSSTTFGDLFVKEGDTYTFDFMGILNDIEVGALMGMSKCDEQCSLEHTHQAGWYDSNGELVKGDDISGEIMLNLYNVTIEELTNGTFDIANIMDGIYFGKALGYKIGVEADYCPEDCDDATEGHKHKYYWVDDEGKFVGEMNNSISNISLQDCMEGGLDINETLGGIKLGSLMGMNYCDGSDCLVEKVDHVHAEGWYDGDGELVKDDAIGDEIMLALYDLTFEELTNGGVDLAELSDGIYFGKALGYKIGVKDGYCPEDNCPNTDADHVHKFYWVNEEGKFVGEMDNALSNIALKDVMEGGLDINETLGDVKVGYIMGMDYCDGSDCFVEKVGHVHAEGWYDGDGNIVTDEAVGDEVMIGLYDLTFTDLTDGNFDIANLMDGIYFGKALGYKIGVKDGYCQENCNDSAVGHVHKFYWVDGEGDFVGEMNNALSNIALADAMNGDVDIDSALNGVKLGDIMGNKFEGGKWYDSDGIEITDENIGDEIMLKLYNKTYGEITSEGIDFTTLTDGIYLGKALGYKIGVKAGYCQENCNNSAVGHVHKFYWVDGEGNFVGDMDNALSNVALKDVMDGTVKTDDILNDVKLGSVMGNEYKNDDWYDGNGDLIDYNNLSGGDKILYNMYDKTISDITNDGLDLTEITTDMHVGEIMSYKGGVGAWQKPNGSGYEATTPLENVIADIPMSELLAGTVDFKTKVNALKLGDVMDPGDSNILKLLADKEISSLDTEIDKLYIGDIMGYKQCTNDSTCPLGSTHVHDNNWYDGDTKVTGVYKALSKYTIGQLSSGDVEIGNDLTVGELIETDGSPILSLLAGETLDSAPDATNKLLLGEVMGYTKLNQPGYCDINCETTHTHNYYWVDGEEGSVEKVPGINAKIANYTIGQVSNGDLNELTDTLVVGDIFEDSQLDTGAFSLMDTSAFTLNDKDYEEKSSVSEIPLNEISDRTIKGVETATYAKLKGAKITLLDGDTENTVTDFYNGLLYDEADKDAVKEGGWVNVKTLPEVIKDIIEALEKLGGF